MAGEDNRRYLRNLQNARNIIKDDLVADIMGSLKPMEPLPTRVQPCGGPRARVKALLLDIYGTLLISGSGDIGHLASQMADKRAMKRLLEAFDLQLASHDLRTELGRAIADVHVRARESGNRFPEVVIENVWQKLLDLNDIQAARRFALCWELITNPVWPMPFLRQLIATCVARGINLGIVSNAQFYTPLLFEWFLAKDLERLGFKPDLIFFSYIHGCAKPSPVLFKKTADALRARGIGQNQAVYLGNDMLNDILPASRCGFQTALFAGDRRSLRRRQDDHRLAGIEPDWTVNSLSQILEAL